MKSLQLLASDPSCNIWVCASAGTGKTKTLIDRILRILIKNVPASQIVCLTYTRAACAQMKTRLYDKLEQWANMETEALESDIESLDCIPTKDLIHRARTLMNAYLYQGESVKIQTLHAFCEELVRKYPIEAKISPFFQIMDTTQETQMQDLAFQKLLTHHHDNQDLDKLSRTLSVVSLKDLLNDCIEFSQKNGVFPGVPLNTVSDGFFNLEISESDLDILQKTTKVTDQNLYLMLRNGDIENLTKAFLTQTGELRKKVCTDSIPSDLKEKITNAQNSFFEYIENQKLQTLFSSSQTLHAVAKIYHEILEIEKKNHHFCTFSDVIIGAFSLLQNSKNHPWVAQNIAESFSHLLLDEAQDTSPLQWDFIKEMIDIIFEPTSTKNPSLFVVGDFKQSIFSFQGASPHHFDQTYLDILSHFKQQNLSFEKIDLNTSFRSTQAVLSFVDKVFEGDLKKGVTQNTLKHNHFRSEPGKTEIMPPSPTAQETAKMIKDVISDETMILFRRRSSYVKQTLYELEKLGVQTSGLDRFDLKQDFLVLDLLALARVCDNPLDDMAVALTLTGPLFKWCETDLENLREEAPAYFFTHSKIQILLGDLIAYAHEHSVLEFFVWFLKQNGAQEKYLEIYGGNGEAILDEFFALIRKFEQDNISSMGLFLKWVHEQDLFIKKDPSTSSHTVFPMTIHGSKGLEAHTVILLEADSTPTLTDKAFIYKNTLFWTPKKESWPQSFKALREHSKEAILDEYNRLLYVALTRARDHLFVFSTTQGGGNSWYKALAQLNE